LKAFDKLSVSRRYPLIVFLQSTIVYNVAPSYYHMKSMKIMKKPFVFLTCLILCTCLACYNTVAQNIDLSKAVIHASGQIASPVRETIIKTLTEEIYKHSGMVLPHSNRWPDSKTPVISLEILDAKKVSIGEKRTPANNTYEALGDEGYIIETDAGSEQPVIRIIARRGRGVLYGIGRLLQTMEISREHILLKNPLNLSETPAYPLRGHQLGYRNTANSWDAWTPNQYEQYIRELVLYGTNAIEDIPMRSGSPGPHMKVAAEEMHRKISQICASYDIDYWVWTPASFDLKDETKRMAALEKHEQFYKSIPKLDAVFFPGGDPGHNHPSDVLPFLQEIYERLQQYHPGAGVWISLQGFDEEKVRYFFDYVIEKQPEWLTGLVNGPSSPPLAVERYYLPDKYKIRTYTDVTHTVRCQYPVEDWDQAFALTLGRECTNPQPEYYARVHNSDAPFTDGFLTYSDGVHDDVNKIIFSQLGWDPNRDIRAILESYCRFFFGEMVARPAVEGILALEHNWKGPLLYNGSIETTFAYWKNLEQKHAELSDNWRWQQLVMRAYYDVYVKRRLVYEQQLEREAYEILAVMHEIGSQKAMQRALDHINRADAEPAHQFLREKIVQYCEDLFQSIQLQTSVPKYQASGYERGAILDFIDYPLNNRWWLADEFDKIREMAEEEDRIARLEQIRQWENPGPGGFYDDVSNIAKSPHVTSRTEDAIDFAWWENGYSRKRLSTQTFQFSPVLEYNKLDMGSDYLIRVAGYGEALLRANGERLKPIKYEKELESFKEFILPKALIKNGHLKITFDKPDEEHLNWRQYSKVSEVWLIKQ